LARALSVELCKRLARLLPMLSSDHAGEVTATAAAITRTLRAAERDWHDLTATLTTVPVTQPQPQPKPKPRPVREQVIDAEYVGDLVHSIRMSGCYLSAKAKGFLDSLEDRAEVYSVVSFTDKQWEWFMGLLKSASVELEVD
jgi:hypothetical protein